MSRFGGRSVPIALGALLAIGGAATAHAGTTLLPSADTDTAPLPLRPHGGSPTLRTGPLSTVSLRFDVPAQTGSLLRATLRPTVLEGTTGPLEAHGGSFAWSERTASFLTPPATEPAVLSSVPSATTGSVPTFDVTTAVTPGGPVGLALRAASLDPATISSREGSAPPLLELAVATPRQDRLAQLVATPGPDAIYRARDDAGALLDGLKVIANPATGPRYLGISHQPDADGVYHLRLSSSSDLRSWHFERELGGHLSQGTLALLEDGSVLVVSELDGLLDDSGTPSGRLRFDLWPSVEALLTPDVAAARSFVAPRQLSTQAGGFEGTPWIVRASSNSPALEIGFHYLAPGAFVDRAATGTLTGFTGTVPADVPTWTSTKDTALSAAVTITGATANVGDAEVVDLGGGPLTLIEGQRTRGDFGSWASYVVDRSGDPVAKRIDVKTLGGSRSFGSPALTILPAPDGPGRVALVSLFIFGEGSAPGEAGPLVFTKPLP